MSEQKERKNNGLKYKEESARPVSGHLFQNARPVSGHLFQNARPVSSHLFQNARPISSHPLQNAREEQASNYEFEMSEPKERKNNGPKYKEESARPVSSHPPQNAREEQASNLAPYIHLTRAARGEDGNSLAKYLDEQVPQHLSYSQNRVLVVDLMGSGTSVDKAFDFHFTTGKAEALNLRAKLLPPSPDGSSSPDGKDESAVRRRRTLVLDAFPSSIAAAAAASTRITASVMGNGEDEKYYPNADWGGSSSNNKAVAAGLPPGAEEVESVNSMLRRTILCAQMEVDNDNNNTLDPVDIVARILLDLDSGKEEKKGNLEGGGEDGRIEEKEELEYGLGVQVFHNFKNGRQIQIVEGRSADVRRYLEKLAMMIKNREKEEGKHGDDDDNDDEAAAAAAATSPNDAKRPFPFSQLQLLKDEMYWMSYDDDDDDAQNDDAAMADDAQWDSFERRFPVFYNWLQSTNPNLLLPMYDEFSSRSEHIRSLLYDQDLKGLSTATETRKVDENEEYKKNSNRQQQAGAAAAAAAAAAGGAVELAFPSSSSPLQSPSFIAEPVPSKHRTRGMMMMMMTGGEEAENSDRTISSGLDAKKNKSTQRSANVGRSSSESGGGGVKARNDCASAKKNVTTSIAAATTAAVAGVSSVDAAGGSPTAAITPPPASEDRNNQRPSSPPIRVSRENNLEEQTSSLAAFYHQQQQQLQHAAAAAAAAAVHSNEQHLHYPSPPFGVLHPLPPLPSSSHQAPSCNTNYYEEDLEAYVRQFDIHVQDCIQRAMASLKSQMEDLAADYKQALVAKLQTRQLSYPPANRTMSESRKLEKSRRAQKRVARRRAKGDGEPSDEQNDK
eukprot:jgi/Bigna1/135717/aug1.30_g10425